MTHASYKCLVVLVAVAICIAGCQSKQPKETKQQQVLYNGTPMKIGFRYPVIEVNGMRPLQGEDEIVLVVPQNSTHDITLKLADENHTVLTGKMQVFELTEFNRGTKIIWITPDEAEYHFAEIIKQGHGEFITYELVGEKRGPKMVKLQLGIRQNR